MTRHDWYRNTTWSDEIALAFEVKLRRVRTKEQYLRIQACTLKHTCPEVAHSLLDRYFALPDQFDAAQAYVDRADAFLAQGKINEALVAYESALNREASFPNLTTQAYVELPYLVATRGIEDRYARALQLLAEHKNRLMFPVDHFKWNAARALIAHACSEVDEVYSYAKAALEAASKESSGFRYHPTVGLVLNSLIEVHERVRRMCGA